MEKLASATKIDVAAVLAVWQVETSGEPQTKGKAKLRFEAHLLFDAWGTTHQKEFDDHFQFGTRPPKNKPDCPQRKNCHYFRSDTKADFKPFHDSQDNEYAALAEAAALAGEEIAIQCASIGGAQILGKWYQLIGYDTPKQMFDSFQDGERTHVLGFFDYCRYSLPNGRLLDRVRKQEWEQFAKGYNGSGATDYATKLKDAFDAATAVLPAPAAPATAKSLSLETAGRSVDLSFPVPLIPQSDKKSLWAASMSMLLSYYREAGITPESLAQQAGLSLRTSYGWDLLEGVRSKFLFKNVSLPSNYSHVPPPAHWYQWLDQFGPLWVTLQGSPSHGVVVSGISGDLTAGNTSIHSLNPWDDRVRFDGDPINFHPENRGRETTLSFDDFSADFSNMGLTDYNRWRILYLGRRPETVAHGLDIRDLTPEEIADAEPRALAAWAESAAGGTARAMGEADAVWAPDASSIDYRHLATAINTRSFAFTPRLLERLCALNRFDVNAGQDEVLFGLRGCQFATERSNPAGWTDSVDLSEAVPDHKNSHCILGVWKRSTARFRLFTGSTVPNWRLMERYRQGGDHANLLPTGRYLFHVGTHRGGTRGEIRGAFIEHGDFVVLRTLNDLTYAIGDTWDSGSFGDNIHPARLDGGEHPPYFSSAGCQTVPGNVRDGRHTGKWAEFREAAGLSASAPGSEDGRRFVYVMLTGREARLLVERQPDVALMRLRFGSSGDNVMALQLALGSAGLLRGGSSPGSFDAATKMAYIRWQTARDSHTADGVVTPSDGAALGFDMIRGQSIKPVAISHSLGTRAVTTDDIVAQIDARQHTRYGSYSGYRATLVRGTVFGYNITVRPGFLKKLRNAEAAAAKAIGGSSPNFGIVSVGSSERGGTYGFHPWGLAVDLNYDSCPYIMHNHGSHNSDVDVLNAELAPVYTRIARLILRRDSVIPKEITRDNEASSRVAALYDSLAEESDAMIRSFHLMQDTGKLATLLSAMPAGTDWRPISGTTSAPTADAMQDLLMADYVTLSGRPGPTIPSKSYPAARKLDAHRPFRGNPKLRAPEFGFLSLRRELVIALTSQGLRWGAIHFGNESGDVMHFDDGFDEGSGITRARKAAKAAIVSGQSWQGFSLAAPGCGDDIAIDERAALVFSKEAPLAGHRDCEHKAVWAAVPDLRKPLSVLVYFHGNDASVMVDPKHPGGKLPAWNAFAKSDLHQLTTNGPITPGVRDDLQGAAQAAPQRPLVLIPEDGVPGTSRNKKGDLMFWAETEAGNLGDPAALRRLIDDVWSHLASLKRLSGAPYVGEPSAPDPARIFLAGHSGGGLPLGYAAASHLALGVPTDLWLLDSTYYDIDNYVAFCRNAKQRNHLGNDAKSSRMVVITRGGKTRKNAGIILQKLQAPLKGQPGFSAVRFSAGQFCPLSGKCDSGVTTPPASIEIVLVEGGASWSDIDRCLRSFPVVFIETAVNHHHIPFEFFPHLLNTAAVP
jgi:hypothetical protein